MHYDIFHRAADAAHEEYPDTAHLLVEAVQAAAEQYARLFPALSADQVFALGFGKGIKHLIDHPEDTENLRALGQYVADRISPA